MKIYRVEPLWTKGKLYQGGHVGERSREELQELDIRIEVNLEPYPTDTRRDPETYLYIHWPLCGPPQQPEILWPLAECIAYLLIRGENILVHCTHGRNRSSLVVAHILSRLGLSAEEAYNKVRERNPGKTFVREIQKLP